MPLQEIKADPERLGAIATSVHVGHNTLAASPNFSRVEAGDVRGRLGDAVNDFITKNGGPREELIQQLDMAWQALDMASRAFADTESALVRALAGGDSS